MEQTTSFSEQQPKNSKEFLQICEVIDLFARTQTQYYDFEDRDKYTKALKNQLQMNWEEHLYDFGAEYYGGWVQSAPNGFGLWKFNGKQYGYEYIGQMVNGRMQGFGKLIWNNGGEEVGIFKDGRLKCDVK